MPRRYIDNDPGSFVVQGTWVIPIVGEKPRYPVNRAELKRVLALKVGDKVIFGNKTGVIFSVLEAPANLPLDAPLSVSCSLIYGRFQIGLDNVGPDDPQTIDVNGTSIRKVKRQ